MKAVLRSFVPVLCCAASIAGAQNQATIEGVLSGRGAYPGSLKAADLPESYKACRIRVAGSGSAGGGLFDAMGGIMMGVMGAFGSMGGDSPSQSAPPPFLAYVDVSWTNGSIVQMAGSEFLVTYAMDLGLADMAAMSDQKGAPSFPDLKLTLVKIAAINSFQPLPNLTKEGFVKAMSTPPAETVAAHSKSQTQSNLKQLALATMMYASDYDDVLPWPQSSRGAVSVIYPYIKSLEIVKSPNPEGAEYYRFNANIGGASTIQESPAAVPMWYEAKPWPDGSRAVAFLDGHVEMVPAQDWPRIEKALSQRYRRIAKSPLPASLGSDLPPQ